MPIDPRYTTDPPEEPTICQCCDEEEATDLWKTTLGKKWICGYCLDFHLKEDTHFLIERL